MQLCLNDQASGSCVLLKQPFKVGYSSNTHGLPKGRSATKFGWPWISSIGSRSLSTPSYRMRFSLPTNSLGGLPSFLMRENLHCQTGLSRSMLGRWILSFCLGIRGWPFQRRAHDIFVESRTLISPFSLGRCWTVSTLFPLGNPITDQGQSASSNQFPLFDAFFPLS